MIMLKKLAPEQADHIIKSELFDPEWYSSHYPDVELSGLDPEHHFRCYGIFLGRLPSGLFQSNPAALNLIGMPKPRKGREILEAHEIARIGDDATALAYADRFVPDDLQYTVDALRANTALRQGNEKEWLFYLNRYLACFNAAPIQLRDGSTLPDRFATADLPSVTGGPLISIILPVWNGQKTIRAAAQSILNQTWKNLELLIIDDASEDGTWEHLQMLAASDCRVKILRNKVNIGPYAAKNIALSMCAGEWLSGQDADDWSHPQRLEQHMQAISQFATPPRSSVSSMIRFEENGIMDRFAPISDYSMDGVCRDAAISCLFERKFLDNDLGAWDCVRFGADSELIARAQTLIGDEFKRLPLISMLCMNFDGSLTNHPKTGVTRTAGPSEVRVRYSDAWRAWHKKLKETPDTDKRLPFPPLKDKRPFPAPQEALVPAVKVRRNYAALTGLDPECASPVTAICSSKRPWFSERVAAMMKAQTHRDLRLIYIAHGPGHDFQRLHEVFRELNSYKILELTDPNEPLGSALNLGLDSCETDLVAKIDDDDFYGPNYIRSSIAALRYSGHENVGIVGRERAYCYVEDMDVLALRYPPSHENSIRSRVFGGTIFWSRSILGDPRFKRSNTGEDSDFFRQALEKGASIFSCEASDYIHLRYSASGAHTWNVAARDFLRPATPLAKGLRLDLAYSSQHSPSPVPVPGQAT